VSPEWLILVIMLCTGACENGGTCVDGLGTYLCQCPAGYTGSSCETEIDECALAPCVNGATCQDYVNSFVCECPRGFSGIQCQINDNDCTARSGLMPRWDFFCINFKVLSKKSSPQMPWWQFFLASITSSCLVILSYFCASTVVRHWPERALCFHLIHL